MHEWIEFDEIGAVSCYAYYEVSVKLRINFRIFKGFSVNYIELHVKTPKLKIGVDESYESLPSCLRIKAMWHEFHIVECSIVAEPVIKTGY